ncbi:MAG: S8 family serine peptidase [bacterium]|nr:S8 family serine peptidase [bacterium]
MRSMTIYFVVLLVLSALCSGFNAFGMPPMTPNLEWKSRVVVEFSETLESIRITNDSSIAELGEPSLDALAHRYKVFGMEKLIPGAQKPSDSAIRDISRYYIIEFPPDTDLHEVAQAYQLNPYVITAEPYIIHTCLYTPNDPWFPEQWALGQVGAETAYDYCRGSRDVVIGIVDMGIDTAHADLRGNLWVNPGEDLNHNGIIEPAERNGIDDDQNGYIDDFWGWNVYQDNNNVQEPSTSDHGTACAGAASAVTDNSIGIASLGYQTRLMTVKAGESGFIYNAMQGIFYCVHNGARVVSMSFGSPIYSVYEQSVISYAWDNGVAIFASGGADGGITPMYPAAYDHVVAVGSTDQSDQLTPFTNYGDWVDLYAPGVNLMLPIHNNGYMYWSGTSFSCQIAAGLACLVWAADTTLTNAEVVQQILTTAVNIDSYNPGHSGLLRIDAGAAVSGVFLNVDLTSLTPIIIIPPNGGSFSYTIHLTNRDNQSHPIDYWSDLVLPNGFHYGPIMGPITRTLSANSVITRQRIQSIPPNAPPGSYLLIAYLGDYASSICDRDTIAFAKQGAGSYTQLAGFVNSEQDIAVDLNSQPLPEGLSFNVSPNPFNPTTTLSFELRAASFVTLEIFDINGRVVGAHGMRPNVGGGGSAGACHAPLQDTWYDAGTHTIPFDGSGLPSGIYFCRLNAGSTTSTVKLVLLK